ncbi:hypothetical protein M433DRAFT_160977, partial [Acidomyces richmondensis BFW]
RQTFTSAISPTAASRSYTGFEVPYQDNRESGADPTNTSTSTATATPYFRSSEAPFFTGDNTTSFLRNYKRIILRCRCPDNRAAMLIEAYCNKGTEDYPTLYTLADAIKERFSQFDKEQYLGTIEALTQPVDIIQYSRAFNRIVRRAQEVGTPIDRA